MKEQERDEILIRIDERTERIEDRIDRHEERIESLETEVDNVQSDTQKNASDITVAKTVLGGLATLAAGAMAKLVGLIKF